MNKLRGFLLGFSFAVSLVLWLCIMLGRFNPVSTQNDITTLQSQIDSLRQKSDKSVLFLAQEELARNGLSLVVVDSTGKASLLRIKEGK